MLRIKDSESARRNEYLLNLFVSIINEHASELTENDKNIIRSLNEYVAVIPKLTITELAEKIYVSSSSLYRLLRKIGFGGYPEFKYRVSKALQENESKNIDTDEYLNQFINEIMFTHRMNQVAIQKAADLILKAKKRFVFGTGWKQKQAADNFSSDMMTYGESFVTLRTKEDLHSAVQYMTKEDLLIFTSLSGNVLPYQASLRFCELENIPLISLTREGINPLSEYSTVALYYVDHQLNNADVHWSALSLNYLFNLLIQTIISQNC